MNLLDRFRQRRWTVVATSFAAVVCCSLLTAASQGNVSAAAKASAPAGSRFAIADFDGDSRPDLATVQVGLSSASRPGYWIDFELSAGVRQSIRLTAPAGGLQIASRDVNGDRSLDLVVTTAWLSQPVAILLNDGHGNFTYREATAFPSITWRYDFHWSAHGAEVRDASALTQTVSEVEAGERFRTPRQRAALAFSGLPRAPANSPKFPVSGRAPPASLLSEV